ncbi:hypothetical protein BDF20DRAFT_879406 [Mycotypha africana]|uniref:uncharacterized protein n=1 Tax=Mycotypha africana TaxID=64632 RepID=UPI0023006D70|nr:uncharacterized protein BDF20DRAFT_879406 [Mycotypha africana]KAI8975577.1 hypothetical protein BDF20DRAFT_879406 [Mycotypha africana]
MDKNNSEDACATISPLLHSEKSTIMNPQIKKHVQASLEFNNITASKNKRIPIPNAAFEDDIDDLKELTKNLKEQLEICKENYKQQQTRIKRLEYNLEIEQGKVNELRHDNQSLRKMAVDITAMAEQEEEYIANKLLRHITGLKKEKGELLIQVEQEEEYLTNMLQKKLKQLQKEKVDLENTLEQEQEYIVNSLQKQLDLFRRQQISPRLAESDLLNSAATALTISASSSTTTAASIASISSVVPKKSCSVNTSNSISAQLQQQHLSNGSVSSGSTTGLIEMLKAEVRTLKAKAAEMEREYFSKQQQCNKYRRELLQHRKENNLSTDDMDDGRLPRVFRSYHSSSSSQYHRSVSNSSQRSATATTLSSSSTAVENSLFAALNAVFDQTPPLPTASTYYSPNSTVLPQSIPSTTTTRSPSISSSSASSSLQRRDNSSRRISSSLFGLTSTPPQHPPQL